MMKHSYSSVGSSISSVNSSIKSWLVPMLVTSKWFTQYWSHVLVGPLCGALPVGVVVQHVFHGKVLFVLPVVAVVPEPLDQIGHEPILILQ